MGLKTIRNCWPGKGQWIWLTRPMWATDSFPQEELYGLRSQMRRAAVSIPSNIAEGQGRKSTAEFLHRLSIAHGSLRELETQIVLSGRLGYLSDDEVEPLLHRAAQVGKLLNGLYNSLMPKVR